MSEVVIHVFQGIALVMLGLSLVLMIRTQLRMSESNKKQSDLIRSQQNIIMGLIKIAKTDGKRLDEIEKLLKL